MSIFEEADGDLAIEFVVFDEQYARTTDGRESDFRRGGLDLADRVAIGADNLNNGIEEHGGGHGLDQDTFEGCLLGLMYTFFPAVSGDHDEMGRGGEIGQSADEPAGFDAVEAGHLPIDEYDVVGLIAVGGLAYEFDPFLAGGSFVDVKSHGEEHAGEDFACLGVVVDDEDATAAHVRVSGATGYRVTLAEEGGKPEGAAVADLAADAHIATHKLSEFFGDGQAKPRAAMLTSRGGVGLFESLEQAAHLLFGKTDPGIG